MFLLISLYKGCIKRLFDLILSLLGLIVALPLILIITLVVCISNKGEVLYIQKRPGMNGEIFRLVKFRTMNNKQDISGRLMTDKERLTTVGRFIRSLSLDELPQLFNVLKGDMSIVGPRPLLTEYLPLYNAHQARRHEVRPGITGWAQVNGRNTLSWEEKFEMDVWYVDHVSFALDMKILILTLLKVLKREGINSGSSATMERFTGS